MAAVPETAPRIGPLGVGEVLDAAIKVVIAHAGTLMRAVLVVVVPVQAIAAVVLLSTVDDPDFINATSSETGFENGDAAFFAGQGVVVLLSAFAVLLATGACFRAIAEAWLGRRPDWRESLRFAARRAPALIWIAILAGLGTLLGTLLCILPGVFLYVAWSVAYPVLFVEDRRGSKALGRSFRLVKGRWWATFAALLVSAILAGIVQTIFTTGLGLLAFVEDSLLFLVLLTTLGGVIAAALTTPFQAAIVALLYFDLRVRNEGFDLEILAQRLGGGPPDPATPGTGGAAPIAPADVPEDVRRQAPYWPPPPGWQPPQPPQQHTPAGGTGPAPDLGGWEPPRPEPPSGEDPPQGPQP